MIPGINRLILDEPALVEAVQEYLDARSKRPLGRIIKARFVRSEDGVNEVHFMLEGGDGD